MGDFSTNWLRLREPVDLRSRDKAVAAALREALAFKRDIKVVDIGCGTGANLRAVAELLGPDQDWTLVDNDAALLQASRETLAGWADDARPAPHGLTLNKDGRTIKVRFRHADIARDVDDAFGGRVDLVTASAFFDLVSRSFIERLVAATVQRSAAFFAALTYNGVQTWLPAGAEDERIRQAFNAHQEGDKGFGPASGPRGVEFLTGACGAAGYRVTIGDSPWRIGCGDAALMRRLAGGVAAAVAETGLVDMAAIAAWRACPRSGVLVGHSDILALPI